ncbi:MAG: DUF5693 family protein [Phascolarctobacterium sp.]|nr:DUF5693 family protein [Phascolarctobacterium sp.]
MKSRYNPILIAIILLGFVVAMMLNVTRHQVEQKNNTVEMAMEYENLLRLAALEGLPEEKVLKDFKAAGINSLMIFDTTLRRLSYKGDLLVATGEELRDKKAAEVFANVPADKIDKDAAFISPAQDENIYNDIVDDLRLRYGTERVEEVCASPKITRVLGSTAIIPDDKYDEPLGVLQAPLGLPAQDMKKVSALGFNIIVRPQNYINPTREKIDAVFNRIEKSGVKVHAFMPCGKESLGYPSQIGYLGQKLNEKKMTVIGLEHYTQLQFAKIDGSIPLMEAVNYKVARSYVIDGLEQKKISVGTALHRWALTDEERNIRVNYVRPFYLPVDGKPLVETNLQYVRDIVQNVKARGYEIGEAGVFSASDDYAPYFPSKIKFIFIALAVVAGGVLYLSLLLDLSRKVEFGLLLVLGIGACALLMLGRGLLTRQLLALGAAVIFPVLSMNFIFDIWDKNETSDNSCLKIIFNGLWQLALAIALSLVGASFLSGILTDSRFLLEIDIYRGVKLTFILPIILVAMLFIKRYDLLNVKDGNLGLLATRLNSLLDTGLTFKHVAALFVLLFIAYYFVGRSGHTGGVPVPAIELKMRAFLEQVMYARPREKEFMVGHPMFFMAVMSVYKRAPKFCQFVLVCAAVIGQGSLVQTFCHMRTPVIMSFVRALDGYVVGIIFGIVGVIVMSMLLPLFGKLKRRYLD